MTMFDERACRRCGCTQYNACVDRRLGPCWWVDEDLCSHCDIATRRMLRVVAGLVLAAGLVGLLFWVARP